MQEPADQKPNLLRETNSSLVRNSTILLWLVVLESYHKLLANVSEIPWDSLEGRCKERILCTFSPILIFEFMQ